MLEVFQEREELATQLKVQCTPTKRGLASPSVTSKICTSFTIITLNSDPNEANFKSPYLLQKRCFWVLWFDEVLGNQAEWEFPVLFKRLTV